MSRAGGLLVLLAASAGPVLAQDPLPPPAALEQVGLTQKLDAALPLELPFLDEHGAPVALGDYFGRARPVLLALGYYRCPMLCGLVLEGEVAALREIGWSAGTEFDVVHVSIDPDETPELARAKKDVAIAAYGRPQAAAGWHFLTGGAGSIAALADAVGFRYTYLAGKAEFAHPAALIVATPEGRVSRYLLGVQFDPRTTRLSLVEAAGGKIGTLADEFLLYCLRYNAATGRYTAAVWRIMRAGGMLALALLAAMLAVLWRRELRARRPA